jgi:hypothetical protein
MLIAKTMNLKHRAIDHLECKDERGASTKAGVHRTDHGIVRAFDQRRGCCHAS